MEKFLASVERRAFRMAELATRSSDDALDILQDAMIALVQKYSDKPPEEWKIEGVDPEDVPKSHRRTEPTKKKSSPKKKPDKPNYNKITKKKNRSSSGTSNEPNYNALKYHNRKH